LSALERIRAGRRKTAIAVGLYLALGVGGCSTLPAAGPTRETLIDEGAEPDAPYMLVEISDSVLAVLSGWPEPSFFGSFGDYGPAVDQRIGVGDGIQVTIWESAAGGLFSSPETSPNQTGARSAVIPSQVVASDGMITVPYAGRIKVVGETPQAVQKIIVQRLEGKAIQPQALVNITSNVSDTVTVTGEVTNGAIIPLSAHPYRILDVIAAAGGVKTPVYETFIELSRGRHTVRVPMQTVINNPPENVFARPGDVITAIRYPLTVTAAGATGHNALVPFEATGMSLEEAVAKAGGLLDEHSDPNGVFVLRYEPTDLARLYASARPELLDSPFVPVVYHVNMRDPAALFLAKRFAMRDKDILYVSSAPTEDLRKVLVLFNLAVSPAYSVGTVGQAGVVR
jgi:polysaccharide biosynthesis/export protein